MEFVTLWAVALIKFYQCGGKYEHYVWSVNPFPQTLLERQSCLFMSLIIMIISKRSLYMTMIMESCKTGCSGPYQKKCNDNNDSDGKTKRCQSLQMSEQN